MNKFKYPRTFHLPFSPGITSDDKVISSLEAFEGREIVITEKMDGENTTIYSDSTTHARSIDSKYHPSRSWVKNYAASLDLSQWFSYRFCGESMFAKHSIHYKNLSSYFYLFNIWDEKTCFNWKSTKQIAKMIGLDLVPILYEGPYDLLYIKSLANTLRDDQEGFVMRVVDYIHLDQWSIQVAKWVRPNHVQTDEHWMSQSIVKNILEV